MNPDGALAMAGVRAYLMEMDPLYSDVIVQRWEEFTGRKAERIASAETACAEVN